MDLLQLGWFLFYIKLSREDFCLVRVCWKGWLCVCVWEMQAVMAHFHIPFSCIQNQFSVWNWKWSADLDVSSHKCTGFSDWPVTRPLSCTLQGHLSSFWVSIEDLGLLFFCLKSLYGLLGGGGGGGGQLDSLHWNRLLIWSMKNYTEDFKRGLSHSRCHKMTFSAPVETLFWPISKKVNKM